MNISYMKLCVFLMVSFFLLFFRIVITEAATMAAVIIAQSYTIGIWMHHVNQTISYKYATSVSQQFNNTKIEQ